MASVWKSSGGDVSSDETNTLSVKRVLNLKGHDEYMVSVPMQGKLEKARTANVMPVLLPHEQIWQEMSFHTLPGSPGQLKSEVESLPVFKNHPAYLAT